MSPHLTKKLKETFPELYHNLGWGFECGNGWFNILWRLSKDILPLAQGREMYAMQVKEKYGTLRFYMNQTTDEIEKRIEQAEEETEVTCETCGEPGKIREGGWISVRCDKHVK